MDTLPLSQSPVGYLVDITGFDPRFNERYAHKAFVPRPLPASIPLSGATYAAVVDAASAVARADQAVSVLPNARLLSRPAIRREAVSTSALEGTYTALSDVLEAELLEEGDLPASVSEVVNYVRAADKAFAWVQEGRPVTVGLLEDLQRMLVQGTRAETAEGTRPDDAGVHWSRWGRVAEARFVPPPPGDTLRDGLLQWEEWIRAESSLPTVVRMAVGHYQFESLHPFNDGNGRLGRLVAVLQLVAQGELRVPVVNLSPWLESRRREYQDHLLRVSQTGDFDPWVSFFAHAVSAQALEAVDRVERLLELKNAFLAKLRAARAKGVSLRIAEELIGYPMLTVTDASRRYGVTFQAANAAVARLVSLGILRQYSRRRYDRVFLCDDVFRVVE